KQAKLLAPCRASVEAALGARPADAAAWEAIIVAAGVEAPADSDKQGQIAAARTLLGALQDAPVDKILAATKETEAAAKAAAEKERQRADSARVRLPLPQGLLPREIAIALGVFFALLALTLSFLSVRAASTRRARTLAPLRDIAKTPQRGLQ